MKKNLFILVFLVFISLSLISQNIIWEENFLSIPADWTLEGNWSIDSTYYQALNFLWTPVIYNYDHSAISPVIALPYNVGNLTINQFIGPYTPENEITSICVIIDSIKHVDDKQ